MKNNDMNDPFKELFKGKDISQPGTDFTANVIGKITELEPSTVITKKTPGTIYNWLLPISGFAVAIAILILLSNFGYINILPENFDFVLVPVFKKVILNFTDIFSSFQLSSTTVAILAAMSTIVIFERLIRMISLNKGTNLLSF